MNSVALTGNDTIILNSRSLTDLSDQDTCSLTFNNNIMEVKTGKNGNSIYTVNSTGENVEVMLRVIRGSNDDKFLNNLLNVQKQSPQTFILMTGEFIKKIGDGQGNVTKDTYLLSGGVFSKNIDAKENVEGDTESAVSVYALMFSKAPRNLG